jgi:hypothetical protein
MKNLFKFGFLALAISLSVAACNTNQGENAASDSIDSTTEVTTDSIEASADSLTDSLDSAAKTDTVQN